MFKGINQLVRRTRFGEYIVFTSVRACTYFGKYAYLNLQVRSTFWRLQLWSVQTTRVVCTNFSRSLYRLR